MADDSKTTMVSLNDVVEIMRLFNRERIGSLISPGSVADCTDRCGCVGGDCSCRGKVSHQMFDRTWAEITAERQDRITELRRQIALLEQKE